MPLCLGVHPGTCPSRLQSFLKQVSLAEHLVEVLPCSNWFKGFKMQNSENFSEIQENCLTNQTDELIPHVQFLLCNSSMFLRVRHEMGWGMRMCKGCVRTQNYRIQGARTNILTEINNKITTWSKTRREYPARYMHFRWNQIDAFSLSRLSEETGPSSWFKHFCVYIFAVDRHLSLYCLWSFPGLKMSWISPCNWPVFYVAPINKVQSVWDLSLALNNYLFSSISTTCSTWLSSMLFILLQVLPRIFFLGGECLLASSVTWKSEKLQME